MSGRSRGHVAALLLALGLTGVQGFVSGPPPCIRRIPPARSAARRAASPAVTAADATFYGDGAAGVLDERPPPSAGERARVAVVTWLGKLVRPLRWLWALLARTLRLVETSTGIIVAAEEGAPTLARGEVEQLEAVRGVATRSFPPPDAILAYFNYGSSPFYTQLSEEAAEAGAEEAGEGEAAAAAGGGGDDGVRWLSHRASKPYGLDPIAAERAADHDSARMALIVSLYEEALEMERRTRRPKPFWIS